MASPASERGTRATGGKRTGRVAGFALAAVALLAATAAPAGAASAPSDVAVIFAGEIGVGANTAVVGMVTSPNRRCLSGRRIVVSLAKSGGAVPLDVAISGRNGGWHARGPTDLLNGSTAINVKVERRKVGRGPGALRCGGVKVELT